jgi:hypothetical protein
MNETRDKYKRDIQFSLDWQVLDMLDIQVSLALATFALLAAILMERSRSSTKAQAQRRLKGPKSPSWWFGKPPPLCSSFLPVCSFAQAMSCNYLVKNKWEILSSLG